MRPLHGTWEFEGQTFSFVSEKTGGLYRGDGDIEPTAGVGFSPEEIEELAKLKTWQDVLKWLRARYDALRDRYRKKRHAKHRDRSGASIRQWEKDNRDRVKPCLKARKGKHRDKNYFKDIVAIDSEGFETGETWYRHRLTGDVWPFEPRPDEKPLDKYAWEGWKPHETFMWASSRVTHDQVMSDDFKADACEDTDYLIHPDTTNNHKVALDPRGVLDWLVSRRKAYGNSLVVAYSFSYDVAQILKHFDYVSAWEIQNQERCPIAKAKLSHRVFRDWCEMFPHMEKNYIRLHNLKEYAKKKTLKKGGAIIYGRGHAKGFAIKYRDRRELEI